MPRPFLAVLLLTVGLWVLCPAEGTAVPKNTPRAAWVTLRGRVVWAGKTVPKRRPIRVTKDRDYLPAAIPDEACVVNPKNRGVRWAFVYLAPTGKRPLPAHPDLKRPRDPVVSVNIVAGRFVPHALALRQGQSLRVTTPRDVAYNLQWQGVGLPHQSGNVLIPRSESYTIKGLKAARLPVRLADAIHPWMRGWVQVFDHPYFAVTDADGRFTIRKAPAGTWRLMVWQEETGWGKDGKNGREVTLGGARETSVRLELKPPEE